MSEKVKVSLDKDKYKVEASMELLTTEELSNIHNNLDSITREICSQYSKDKEIRILQEVIKEWERRFYEVNIYINTQLVSLRETVQYYEKQLDDMDKSSTYYDIYVKNIHKANARRVELINVRNLLKGEEIK